MNMAGKNQIGFEAPDPIRQFGIAVKFPPVPAGRRTKGRGVIDPDPTALFLGTVALQLGFHGLFADRSIPPGTDGDKNIAQHDAVAIASDTHLAHPAHPGCGFFAIGVARIQIVVAR